MLAGKKLRGRPAPAAIIDDKMTNDTLLSVFMLHENTKFVDDTVTVKRENGNLRVRYYDSVSHKSYSLLLTNTSLGHYVKQLCRLLKRDIEPFSKVQFNFHGFPTHMTTPDALNDKFCRMLEDISGIVSESAFADLPGGICCDCDDDDMPDLVSVKTDPWDRHY